MYSHQRTLRDKREDEMRSEILDAVSKGLVEFDYRRRFDAIELSLFKRQVVENAMTASARGGRWDLLRLLSGRAE
jgi:hypothetical protein